MFIDLENEVFCVFCDPRAEIRKMDYEKAQELIKKGKVCPGCVQIGFTQI
ncbi:MAG: hypothetical protein AAB491_02175 [Patescibacteria group bacterium]